MKFDLQKSHAQSGDIADIFFQFGGEDLTDIPALSQRFFGDDLFHGWAQQIFTALEYTADDDFFQIEQIDQNG